jgi:arylformamidase
MSTGKTKSEWIDISYPLSDGMLHMPQEPIAPHIDWVSHPSKHPNREVPISMLLINICVHQGTHIDAPRHFDPKGTPIDEMPADVMMGPARVIEIKDTESVKVEELEPHNIQAGERILFKTINSSKHYKTGKYVEDFVYTTNEAAQFLADKKVSVVGMDYFAITGYAKGDVIAVHQILLFNGVWILETIDLSEVEAGNYELVCLPIRLKEGDAAPARAFLRPL